MQQDRNSSSELWFALFKDFFNWIFGLNSILGWVEVGFVLYCCRPPDGGDCGVSVQCRYFKNGTKSAILLL